MSITHADAGRSLWGGPLRHVPKVLISFTGNMRVARAAADSDLSPPDEVRNHNRLAASRIGFAREACGVALNHPTAKAVGF